MNLVVYDVLLIVGCTFTAGCIEEGEEQLGRATTQSLEDVCTTAAGTAEHKAKCPAERA